MKVFLQEVRTLVRLRHKNVVQFYGCWVENNDLAIVMEYLDKMSIAEHLTSIDARLHKHIAREVTGRGRRSRRLGLPVEAF